MKTCTRWCLGDHSTHKIKPVSIIVAFRNWMAHCKIEAVQWIKTEGHLRNDIRYINTYIHTYIHRSWGTLFDKCGARSGLPNYSHARLASSRDHTSIWSGGLVQIDCTCAQNVIIWWLHHILRLLSLNTCAYRYTLMKIVDWKITFQFFTLQIMLCTCDASFRTCMCNLYWDIRLLDCCVRAWGRG